MAAGKGTRVGGYRLDEEVGTGGMGTVWAATDVATGRRVAVKMLLAKDEKAKKRFRREAEAARAVKHPNIVTTYETIEHDGAPVIVMELLRGEPLDHHIERNGKLQVAQAASILLPVVSAVGTCHAQGIVHRDLKPANIFLAEEGEGGERRTVVKVLDFGVAKLLLPGQVSVESGTLTNTGAAMGTWYYMAPEQCRGDKDVDHRADVWALGIILYECLSGRRPFTGDNPLQIINKIQRESAPPIDAHVPALPDDARDIMERMLVADRDARLQDLRELKAVLDRYAEHASPGFGPASKAPSSDEPSLSKWKIQAGDGIVDPEARTADINSGADLASAKAVPASSSKMPSSRAIAAGALVVMAVAVLLVVKAVWRSDDAPWRAPIAPMPRDLVAPATARTTAPTASTAAPVPLSPAHPDPPDLPARPAATATISTVVTGEAPAAADAGNESLAGKHQASAKPHRAAARPGSSQAASSAPSAAAPPAAPEPPPAVTRPGPITKSPFDTE